MLMLMPTSLSSARNPRRPRHQRGLTLVELMVGITLGLVIVAALLVLFANASSSGQNLARSSAQIENGRYVSEILREDIRLAGFWGEMPTPPTGPDYTNPDPCLTTPIGFASPSASSALGLPTPIWGIKTTDVVSCLNNRKAGTAALAIRYLSTAAPIAAAAASAPQYYVQYSFCGTDIYPSVPLLKFDTTSANFTLKNFACSAANSVRAYVSRIYYVADCNVCSPSDGIPTLKRVDLVGSTLQTTSVAEGIEQLRFEYGFDTAFPMRPAHLSVPRTSISPTTTHRAPQAGWPPIGRTP